MQNTTSLIRQIFSTPKVDRWYTGVSPAIDFLANFSVMRKRCANSKQTLPSATLAMVTNMLLNDKSSLLPNACMKNYFLYSLFCPEEGDMKQCALNQLSRYCVVRCLYLAV